ncbi:hypothetical protein LTR97_009364 [Elasticomyces elasticus]|uniref:Uncharacterized protein n=1 Tax=Elasticomyces elasticus TaxID=574655 RepID=A0AAN7ZZR9_9PEZI|nr:hypothetical protein LTR97_009364 [Elasticomyces elasticus]
MDDDPDWLEFQACSKRSQQIIHQLHSRRSGQTAARYTTTSMPQMPEKEPGRAYTANDRTGAIWEAMENADIARRDAEYDLVLSDSEDEPATATSPTQPAALPEPQSPTSANSVTLPTVKVPTKSGFSRIASPRLLCRCSCGCSRGYYERKRGTNFQCAPCIKGKTSRCAAPSQAGAGAASSQQGSHVTSQIAVQGSSNTPQPLATQIRPSAPTLPTSAGTVSTRPQPRQMAQSEKPDDSPSQSTADDVSQPRNDQNLDGAGGDAHEPGISRTAAEKQSGYASAVNGQTVVAQEIETARSTGKAAIRGQGDLAMSDGFPPTSYKGKGKRRMSEDGYPSGAALATSSKCARASEGEEAVWRDQWVPAGPLQLRWGGLRD